MNKLLRNPWVVAALVLGMAAVWWVEMRDIFFPGGVVADNAAPATVISTEQSADATLTDAVNPTDTIAIEPLAESPTVPTQLRWDRAPSRDPFGPATVSAPPALELPVIEESAPTATVAAPPALPTLEAVLKTPSAQIAVIDGRIVRVGDKVSGRPVLKIDAASVALGRGLAADQPLLLRLPAR